MASFKTGQGPLKTMPLAALNKRTAMPTAQQVPPVIPPKIPAVKQPVPSMPAPMISSPMKPGATAAPPPRSPTVASASKSAIGAANVSLSPYGARPRPKMSPPLSVPPNTPAAPKTPSAAPLVGQASLAPSNPVPTGTDGPDSFPIDEEALLQAEAEAERKNKPRQSNTPPAPQSAPIPPAVVPSTQGATTPTQFYTTQASIAPTTAPSPASPAPVAPPAVSDEALRTYQQQEISALKYKLQVREQENEKTKHELRARHSLYTEVEKKVQQLSAQLAFKNQELHDMDITLEQVRVTTPPAHTPAAAASTRDMLHTPEKAHGPEDGSESQQEATDLEEATDESRDPLTAQRFKCAKPTQHSPQKRKPKASQPTLAVTPSSMEKKRRIDEPNGTGTGFSNHSDVDALKKKLRACTSRLQNVKRALNGEFDALDGSPVGVAPTPMVGVEATSGSVVAANKELAWLRGQLAAREEFIRQQEEARKVELQEKEAAVTALKRMEDVIIKAEQAMKLMESERTKLIAVVQEVKSQSQKVLEERVEMERALVKAEKDVERLVIANKELQIKAQSAEERLESAKQEVERIKVHNEELGNECAAAKASREQESRRASKAEKDYEETRTRLLSVEQRAAEAAKQIHEDALRIAHMRRQHAQQMCEQRALFDEQLKKLTLLPSEEAKCDLKSSGERSIDERCSAPM